MFSSPVGVVFALCVLSGVARMWSLGIAFKKSPNRIAARDRLEDSSVVEASCGSAQGLLYRAYGCGYLICDSDGLWLTWPKTYVARLSQRTDGGGIRVPCAKGTLVVATRTPLAFYQFRFPFAPQDVIVWVRPRAGRRIIKSLGLVEVRP